MTTLNMKGTNKRKLEEDQANKLPNLANENVPQVKIVRQGVESQQPVSTQLPDSESVTDVNNPVDSYYARSESCEVLCTEGVESQTIRLSHYGRHDDKVDIKLQYRSIRDVLMNPKVPDGARFKKNLYRRKVDTKYVGNESVESKKIVKVESQETKNPAISLNVPDCGNDQEVHDGDGFKKKVCRRKDGWIQEENPSG